MQLDSETVMVGRCVHYQIDILHDHGWGEISYARRYRDQYFAWGSPWVSAARDQVVHYFKTRSTCEWLNWIDTDVGFCLQDFDFLLEQFGSELAVCGTYPKKRQDGVYELARFGLGFARVHRSVYERIDALDKPDGSPMALRYRAQMSVNQLDVKGDEPTPPEFEEFVQYHPQGVSFDQSWRGEDHGFWMLCKVAQIPIRLETRTCLGHTGLFTWWQRPEPLTPGKFATDDESHVTETAQLPG